MVDEPYVNHIPTMTGGVGFEDLRDFYANHFIGVNPSDFELVPVSRTVGVDSLVDEFVLRFTHTTRMDWMLPGVDPRGLPIAGVETARKAMDVSLPSNTLMANHS